MNSLRRSTQSYRTSSLALFLIGMLYTYAGSAQTVSTLVYVCEQNNIIKIQNTDEAYGRSEHCQSKIIKTTTRALAPNDPYRINNPTPAPNALILNSTSIPLDVQQKRDASRAKILWAELQGAEKTLNELKSEYNNGQPQRLGNERNYQNYLNRVSEIKQKIGLAEANVMALQRELSHSK